MKIINVRSFLHEYELNRPVADANKIMQGDVVHGVRRRADVAVFVSADEGVEGVAVGK